MSCSLKFLSEPHDSKPGETQTLNSVTYFCDDADYLEGFDQPLTEVVPGLFLDRTGELAQLPVHRLMDLGIATILSIGNHRPPTEELGGIHFTTINLRGELHEPLRSTAWSDHSAHFAIEYVCKCSFHLFT